MPVFQGGRVRGTGLALPAVKIEHPRIVPIQFHPAHTKPVESTLKTVHGITLYRMAASYQTLGGSNA
jgi:hypothetical protein